MLELEIVQGEPVLTPGTILMLQVLKPVATTPLEFAPVPAAVTMNVVSVVTPPMPARLSHDIVVPVGVSGITIVQVVGVPPPTGTATTSIAPVAQPETFAEAKTEYTAATPRTLSCWRRPKEPENEHGARSVSAAAGDGETLTRLPTKAAARISLLAEPR